MSAANDTCNLGPTFWKISENAEYVCYDILPYLYFPIGVFSHSVSLIAFYKHWKAETAFGYQGICAFTEIAHVFSLAAFIFTNFHWCGFWRTGVAWFMNSYILMFWAAHISLPAMHTAVTNALLTSLVMTIDRVLALAIPFKYKNFNHKRQQILAFIICTIISAGSSVFDGFRLNIVGDGGPYVIERNLKFIMSPFASVSAHLRNALRVIGVVALISGNAMMVWYFQKRGQETKQIAWGNEQNEKIRKAQERNLLILTVAQSIQTAVKILGEVSLLFIGYTLPWLAICGYTKLLAPIVDSVNQIADIVVFCVVLIVNKQFRMMVFHLFRKGTGVMS